MATPHLQVAMTLPTPTLDEKTRHFHAAVTTNRQPRAPARFKSVSIVSSLWQHGLSVPRIVCRCRSSSVGTATRLLAER
jgi:hypothetical protein